MAKMIKKSICISVCLAAGSASVLAVEQARLEEVVITATKTGATLLQDTPMAITAFSTDQIDRTGIQDVRDLMAMTPNLNVAQNSAFAQIYIRGIGSNNVFAGSDPSSTIHIDGVYMARPAAYFFNFLDVERVEVLRGPQGTIYGRNSVGGTINVISRRPDEEFQAKLQATTGNYSLTRGEGYISGPLIKDRLAGSVALMRSTRDGYLENIVPGVDDIDAEDTLSLRAQLRSTPSDSMEILLRADYTDDSGQIAGNVKLLESYAPLEDSVLQDYRKVALGTEGFMEREAKGLALEVNKELTDNIRFSSLSSYRENTLKSSADTDATSDLILVTSFLEKQDQFSQEFNLSGDTDRLSYVLGLYYFEEAIDANPGDTGVRNFSAGVFVNPSPEVETKSWAIFGEAHYDLSDSVSATLGLRYTEEDKSFDQEFTVSLLANDFAVVGPIRYNADDTYEAWTPKIGLEFRPTDEVMFYASATRGFKSGGFNFASANAAQGFDPEYLWSYEGGIKSDLFDRRVRINGTLFYYDYTDLQVQSFLTPGVIDITNAADAEVTGLELEFLARPNDALEFGVNLAYLDATYENYPQAPVAGGTLDASGNKLNSAPDWNYSLHALYEFPIAARGEVFLRAEYSWRDEQFFTVANDDLQMQGNYSLLNASAGFTTADGNWRLVAFGRNLTDEEYIVSSGSFTARPAGRVGQPRTYGLRLTYQY